MPGTIHLVRARSKKEDPNRRRFNCQRPCVPRNPYPVAELGSAKAASAAYAADFDACERASVTGETPTNSRLWDRWERLIAWCDEAVKPLLAGEDIELGCCGEGKHCHCETLRNHLDFWVQCMPL